MEMFEAVSRREGDSAGLRRGRGGAGMGLVWDWTGWEIYFLFGQVWAGCRLLCVA